jgi:hypothetical protein
VLIVHGGTDVNTNAGLAIAILRFLDQRLPTITR